MPTVRRTAFATASLAEITDQIERVVHPALREHVRALEAAVAELGPHRPDAVTLRSLVGQIGVATVAQTDFESKVLFPRVRAIERARFGEGAWPPGSTPPLEECRNKLREEHHHLGALLGALTSDAAGLGALAEIAAAMAAELEQATYLEEDGLFPRGLGLEPHFGLQ